MPQFLKFPAIPASIPANASSTIIHSSGFKEILSAAVKKTSGCGFECLMSLPSAIASKKSIKPILSRMSFVFLLDDAIAIFKPNFLISLSASSVSGSTESGVNSYKEFRVF